MRRISMTIAAVAGSISVLLGSAAAQAETLRLGHHHAVGGTVDKAANKFAELVAEKTDNRIEVRVFPGAQLGQEREAYALLNQGAVDVSITSAAILETLYPPMAVTSIPFGFQGWDHARELYQGEFGQALAAGVRENTDSVVLSYIHLGFRDLLFIGEAPTTLAGIKGMRMRSPENTVWIKMFELMGASPTPITWGEVYSAMQTGIAQGLDSPPATAIDMKFNEVVKSLLRTNHMFGSMVFAMNEGKFDALSPGDQQLILEAAGQAADYSDLENAKPDEALAYDRLAALGISVVDPADPQEWRDAMIPLADEIAARHPDNPGFIAMMRAPN
jgi:tripartite ATP-independent transporter DctP family solute receptor